MPKYIVDIPSIIHEVFEVDAKDEAEAIQKAVDFDGELVKTTDPVMMESHNWHIEEKKDV